MKIKILLLLCVFGLAAPPVTLTAKDDDDAKAKSKKIALKDLPEKVEAAIDKFIHEKAKGGKVVAIKLAGKSKKDNDDDKD